MIGMNSLGYMGRLGNQMFQFAALKGIARNRGFNYCLPHSDLTEEYPNVKVYDESVAAGKAQHTLHLPFTFGSTSGLNIQYLDPKRPTAVESGFCFDENLFNRVPDWVCIQGYFQSEKYFKHIRDELLLDYTFQDYILNPCKEMMSQFDEPPISLHVRRTDYTTNPNHTAIPLKYYESALKEVPTVYDSCDVPVLVFSDDPEWCKEQKLFSGSRFMIAEGNSGYVDMCLMTMCSYHIIANSSFSWWGAWLADSKKVIAPSGWFAESNNQLLDTKDLIPEDWVIVKS